MLTNYTSDSQPKTTDAQNQFQTKHFQRMNTPQLPGTFLLCSLDDFWFKNEKEVENHLTTPLLLSS